MEDVKLGQLISPMPLLPTQPCTPYPLSPHQNPIRHVMSPLRACMLTSLPATFTLKFWGRRPLISHLLPSLLSAQPLSASLACSSTPWWAPLSLSLSHVSTPSTDSSFTSEHCPQICIVGAPLVTNRSPCCHFMVHSKWATLLSSFREWFCG
jgi:hypothetical protein